MGKISCEATPALLRGGAPRGCSNTSVHFLDNRPTLTDQVYVSPPSVDKQCGQFPPEHRTSAYTRPLCALVGDILQPHLHESPHLRLPPFSMRVSIEIPHQEDWTPLHSLGTLHLQLSHVLLDLVPMRGMAVKHHEAPMDPPPQLGWRERVCFWIREPSKMLDGPRDCSSDGQTAVDRPSNAAGRPPNVVVTIQLSGYQHFPSLLLKGTALLYPQLVVLPLVCTSLYTCRSLAQLPPLIGSTQPQGSPRPGQGRSCAAFCVRSPTTSWTSLGTLALLQTPQWCRSWWISGENDEALLRSTVISWSCIE